ncbi:hypothetical protein K501DRAFT_275038 [Backusella circina FSU 941]|nr:hypothetical protein K501DRAFT_280607 [Backusella circina FSU 941]KAI8880998.1 hypothetical protein K501DRAFT_275038 [Backusella circina FSU 941]
MVRAILLITTAVTLLMAVSALEPRKAPELAHLEPGHKFYKSTKKERQMRDKLLKLVKNDEDAAFEMLNDLRKDRANMAKSSSKVQKRGTPMEPGHRFYKSTKKERDMRDKLLEFVKNDEEAAFKLLNDIREGRADVGKISWKRAEKREVFETDSPVPTPITGKKITKQETDMRDRLLNFVRNDPNGARKMLNRLKLNRKNAEDAKVRSY